MASKSVIGNLQIRLTAVTTSFTKGMGLATRRTRAFTRLMRTDLSKALPLIAGKLARLGLRGVTAGFRLLTSIVKKFAKILTLTLVVALAATTAALVLLAKSAFTTIDRLAKSSRIIGITVNELKAFELAAGEAGVETKALEKALRNMTRMVNEAAKGTGEAKESLEDMGLSAENLAKLSIPEQFMEIADALAQIQDAGERIQLASDLFGARGLALINLTSEAIRSASRDIKTLGIEISDIDAAGIERANDAAARVKLAFRELGSEIAIRTAPIIEAFSNAAIKKLSAVGGVAEIVNAVVGKLGPIVAGGIDFIGVAAQNALGFMAGVLEETGKFFAEIERRGPIAANAFAGALLGAADTLKLTTLLLQAATVNLLAGAAVYAQAGEGVIERIFKAVVPGADLRAKKAGGAAGKAFGDAAKAAALDSLIASADEINARLLEAIRGVETANLKSPLERLGLSDEGIERTAGTISKLAFSASVTAERLAEMTRTINESGGAASNLHDAIQQIIEDNKGLVESTQQAGIEIDELFDLENGSSDLCADIEEAGRCYSEFELVVIAAGHAAADGIASALTGALLRGEDAFASLRRVALAALEDIIQGFIRAALIRAAVNLAGSFGGGGGGGGAGSTASSSAASSASLDKFTEPGAKIAEAIEGLRIPKLPVAALALSAQVPQFGSPGEAINTLAFAPAPVAAGGGGDLIVNNIFNGPTTGNDAIKAAVAEGIRSAQPDLTNIAVAETQRRFGRDPRFFQKGR